MGMDGAEPRLDGARGAVTLDDDALEHARLGFHRDHPQRSSKRVVHVTQALAAVAWIAMFVWAFRVAPTLALGALHVAALALFAVATLWRLAAAAKLKADLSRLAEPGQWPIYSILCPLYREAHVVPDLAAALARLDYPVDALDIKFLVEGDDEDTIAAALAVADTAHIEVVIVPPAHPRTKPKALNAGLARARGDYVVVYDAEDRPNAQQLRAALAAFEDGGARLAGVQAPLVIDNGDETWIARQFAAEYAIQFRELLPLLAKFRLPLPLGGSSNHFRTEALRAAGGWDPFNVCEDRRNFASKLNRFRTRTFHIPFVSQSCASAA